MKVISARPKDMGLLVVVGGPGGSGASTIARYLARHLQLHYVYGGMLMREYAKKLGYKDINEFFGSKEFIENPNLYDRSIDEKLVKFSYNPNVLIDSKVFSALATNLMIPCTAKIWLTADIKARVYRTLLKSKEISEGTRITKRSHMYKEIANKLMQRYSNDKNRYQKLYGIDYDSPEKYNDIVIDTSSMNAAQTLNFVLRKLKDGQFIK